MSEFVKMYCPICHKLLFKIHKIVLENFWADDGFNYGFRDYSKSLFSQKEFFGHKLECSSCGYLLYKDTRIMGDLFYKRDYRCLTENRDG